MVGAVEAVLYRHEGLFSRLQSVTDDIEADLAAAEAAQAAGHAASMPRAMSVD